MRRAIILSLATLAGLTVFLKVWADAPAYEHRRAIEREHRRLGTEYGVAWTQVTSLVRNRSEDAPAVIQSELDRRPHDLVERFGVAEVLWSEAARDAFNRGHRETATAMWGNAAARLPERITRSRARSWGFMRQIAAARTLAEVGGPARADEATMLASLADRHVASVPDDQLNNRTILMLNEMGWAWKRLGRDDRALSHFRRYYDWLSRQDWANPRRAVRAGRAEGTGAGGMISSFNLACYAALAGRRDEALSLIEQAVREWGADGRRVVFTPEHFDIDPDLDDLRDDPRFIAARQELRRRADEREERLREALEQMEQGPGAGSVSGSDPMPPEAANPIP